MAEFHPLAMPETPPAPAPVRLELRYDDGPCTQFHLPLESILIGSVPGCDVRLPGGELPPLLCVLTPEPGGLRLRKLALQPAIDVNGQRMVHALLTGDDRLAFGRFEVHIQFSPPNAAKPAEPAVKEMVQAQQRLLEEGIRRLAQAQKQLADDRRDWEQDAEKQAEELAAKMRHALARNEALAQERAQLAAERMELDRRTADLKPAAGEAHRPESQNTLSAIEQNSPLYPLRTQLEAYRDELYDRYKKRRDHLLALQESVSHAARKVQEQKRVADADWARVRAESEKLAARADEMGAEAEKVARERAEVTEQHRLIEDWQREIEKEHQTRVAEVQAEEKRQARERQHLDALQVQQQCEEARLKRLQQCLVEREGQCDVRANQLEEQTQRLREVTTGLQEQAKALEADTVRHAAASERLVRQQEELDQRVQVFNERAANLESEQATLATLRNRAERLQAELTQREQQLTHQRLRQDEEEVRLRGTAQQLQGHEIELHRQREQWLVDKRAVEARAADLEVQSLQVGRREQELIEKDQGLHIRQAALDQAQQAVSWRGEELNALQAQLTTRSGALETREQQLAQARQATDALQEQLRQRTQSVAERERLVAELSQKTEETANRLQERQAALDALCTALKGREESRVERENVVQRQCEQLRADWTTLEAERHALQREREEADRRHREATAAGERLESERRALELRLPEVMQQAQAALERLASAREQLREHLREVHEYTQQCQKEFQTAQADLLRQAEQLRGQQHALDRAQDEQRHAVSSFRQYLSEWQGQIADLQRSLSHGESDLERRQTQLAEQARQIDETSSRLHQKEEQLEDRERDVRHVREELGRHLADVQQWYRHKLRELAERKLLLTIPGHDALWNDAETRRQGDGASSDAGTRRPGDAAIPGPRVSASPRLRVGVPPDDRRLVDLLTGMALIDLETLDALLEEARQCGSSLKDALLDGDYLTPFQLELIEAGQLEALVLGPLRIVDRLRLTPLETVYRVFDPRRGEEALLRRLSAAVTDERRDEFRAKFEQAATLRHPHLAATLEVLDMEGSPAVLQEWVDGVPSGEWREQAGVPGVGVRLLQQAAAGLEAAHAAGLVHGHLHAGRVLLTETGELKICGLGEPDWLLPECGQLVPRVADPHQLAERVDDSPGPSDDLAALGHIAKAWFTVGARQRPQRRDDEPLQAILQRLLTTDAEQRYPSATALLAHIEQVQAALGDHAGAWERLVRFIRERLQPADVLEERQSA